MKQLLLPITKTIRLVRFDASRKRPGFTSLLRLSFEWQLLFALLLLMVLRLGVIVAFVLNQL